MPKTTTVTPIQVLDIQTMLSRPKRLFNCGSSISGTYSTKPLLAVHQYSRDGPFDLKDPTYYLTLPSPPIKLWPAPSSTSITLHGHDPAYNGKGDIIARATITHPWFGACMCTIGSISIPQSTTTSLSKTSTEEDIFISSGLGHGGWRDRKLGALLGFADASKKPLNWCAGNRKWENYDSHEKGCVTFEWEGRGTASGGSIMLKTNDGKDVLAIYKARGAKWVKGGDDGGEEKEEEVGRTLNEYSGASMSSLGILGEEERSEEVIRHMILACVGIEEQILRSNGFNGSYHGVWR